MYRADTGTDILQGVLSTMSPSPTGACRDGKAQLVFVGNLRALRWSRSSLINGHQYQMRVQLTSTSVADEGDHNGKQNCKARAH
jgi:hypothetical protein